MNQEKISALAEEIGQEHVPELLGIFLTELNDYQVILTDPGGTARLEHLKEISHALKSSAASFGADQLCALAIDIDMRGKQGKLTEASDTEHLVELLQLTHAAYTTLVKIP